MAGEHDACLITVHHPLRDGYTELSRRGNSYAEFVAVRSSARRKTPRLHHSPA
jgi:hypothetical protein